MKNVAVDHDIDSIIVFRLKVYYKFHMNIVFFFETFFVGPRHNAYSD